MEEILEEEIILSSFISKEGVPFRVEDLEKPEQNNGNNEKTFDAILTQLLEKIEIPSIKNSLQDRLIINKITSEGIHIITISKVAQLVFNNKDHMKYIEEKLSEVMGSPIAIYLTFENKDSYFARKLENI